MRAWTRKKNIDYIRECVFKSTPISSDLKVTYIVRNVTKGLAFNWYICEL